MIKTIFTFFAVTISLFNYSLCKASKIKVTLAKSINNPDKKLFFIDCDDANLKAEIKSKLKSESDLQCFEQKGATAYTPLLVEESNEKTYKEKGASYCLGSFGMCLSGLVFVQMFGYSSSYPYNVVERTCLNAPVNELSDILLNKNVDGLGACFVSLAWFGGITAGIIGIVDLVKHNRGLSPSSNNKILNTDEIINHAHLEKVKEFEIEVNEINDIDKMLIPYLISMS